MAISSEKMIILVSFIFLSSLILVKIYQKIACFFSIYDIPNNRSSHNKPVPLGAGITFSLCIIPVIFYLKLNYSVYSNSLYLLLFGSMICALVGFWDDIRQLHTYFRLFIQFILSLGTMLYLTDGLNIPFNIRFLPFDIAVLSFLFGILFIMWMINLFNFMDGLDGLLGSQVFILGICSYFLSAWSGNYSLGILYLVFSALTLPFLLFNWRPAKIFMGDAGAYFFGFCFAVLGLIGKIEYSESLVAHVILMGALITDATFTLILKVITTGSLFSAHRKHLFQILRYKYLLRTSRIVYIYLIVTVAWFFPWSVLALIFPNYSVLFCFISYASLLPIFFVMRRNYE